MIAQKYCTASGSGVAKERLSSFDNALINAGVGNYNLVKLSSILPAYADEFDVKDIRNRLKEGSLLPVAYATITSDAPGMMIASGVAIGFPQDADSVGVIMEYSALNSDEESVNIVLGKMIQAAFRKRGWALRAIQFETTSAVVPNTGECCTTFACVAEI